MRLFGFIIKFIFLFSFLASIAAGSLAAYSLHDNPLVTKARPLSTQQVKQVKAFIKSSNPSRYRAGRKYSTSVTEKQLNLFISHSLARFNDRLRAKIRLFNGSVYIVASLRLPSNPVGNYLNITTELKKNANQVMVNSLKVGDVKVPGFIASLLLKTAHNEMGSRIIEYRSAINSITQFQLNRGRASIHYVWNPVVANQIKNRITSSVISSGLRKRIVAYTHHLATVSRSISERKPSLTILLQPMFKLAIERSKKNNPVEENRALFITLGAHMLGKNIPLLLGNRTVQHVPYRNYYLHNRNDLSKHFIISSALTAIADPAIAQAIGLEKEIDDSTGGSGFSFADLAADRAGVDLANMGLASKHQAQLLQHSLASAYNESDFMPSINSLQEDLQDVDFKILYKNTDSTEYKRVIKIIDQRIAECAVYQI